MSDIPSIVTQFPFLTPAAMLGGIYWMLATDKIVTGASHRRELAEKDKRIAERDKVIEKQEKVIQMRDEQVAHLTVIGEAFVKIQDAIDDLAKRNNEGGVS